ncbi:MAG: DNA-protecting protein DprA [Elusimicrobia bacterium]|nr:DNA-protecting protein DprA [Elusimicrobiota bacterium]
MTLHRLKRGEPSYPELLASIPDAPASLYVRGRLDALPAVAIVGSRRPTAYGRRAARTLAADAARAGLAVVSGLARGIDTEAHEAALAAGGVTWAVLGSGLDRVYPPENRGLAGRIISRGAVLSEFEPGEGPEAWRFPRRNRIISGLAWVTVVVEGLITSGSLITAKLALDQGREVGAVPGPIDSPMSQGPLYLLESGAFPVRCFSDVLARLPSGLSLECHGPVKEGGLDAAGISHYKEDVGGTRQKILELLGSGEIAFDELVKQAALDGPALLRLLAELEIDGLVESLPGQNYARR